MCSALQVNFLCAEMSLAFQQQGTVVPPWRQVSSMLSKWMPRKSMDEQVSHGGSPLVPMFQAGAPFRSSTSLGMAGALPIRGHWTGAFGQQARMVMEPQRVMLGGNFTAVPVPGTN